jgi:hypothetical protein
MPGHVDPPFQRILLLKRRSQQNDEANTGQGLRRYGFSDKEI